MVALLLAGGCSGPAIEHQSIEKLALSGDWARLIELLSDTSLVISPPLRDHLHKFGCKVVARLPYNFEINNDTEDWLNWTAGLLTLDSSNANAICLRSDALRAAREFESALAELDRIEATGDPPLLYYLSRALIFRDRGGGKTAISTLGIALQRHADNPAARTERGRLFLDYRDTLRALEDFDAAIALDPSAEAPRFYRAQIRHHLGLHQDEFDDYKATLNANPRSWATYTQRAMCLQERHQNEDALVDVARALEINPEDWEARFRFGYLCTLKADSASACQVLRDYLNLAPLSEKGKIITGHWEYMCFLSDGIPPATPSPPADTILLNFELDDYLGFIEWSDQSTTTSYKVDSARLQPFFSPVPVAVFESWKDSTTIRRNSDSNLVFTRKRIDMTRTDAGGTRNLAEYFADLPPLTTVMDTLGRGLGIDGVNEALAVQMTHDQLHADPYLMIDTKRQAKRHAEADWFREGRHLRSGYAVIGEYWIDVDTIVTRGHHADTTLWFRAYRVMPRRSTMRHSAFRICSIQSDDPYWIAGFLGGDIPDIILAHSNSPLLTDRKLTRDDRFAETVIDANTMRVLEQNHYSDQVRMLHSMEFGVFGQSTITVYQVSSRRYFRAVMAVAP